MFRLNNALSSLPTLFTWARFFLVLERYKPIRIWIICHFRSGSHKPAFDALVTRLTVNIHPDLIPRLRLTKFLVCETPLVIFRLLG